MATRRQEKVARVVKEVVSDVIANDLNDPRIEGIVSVTRVEMAADLRSADVYLSIFDMGHLEEGAKKETNASEAGRNKTFTAIMHAKRRIQSVLADRLRSKFCPVLRFHTDEKFKKALETIRLIDQAADELKKKDSAKQEQN